MSDLGAEHTTPRRRAWRRVGLALLVAAASAALWGFGLEPRRLVVEDVTIAPVGWPSALDGLTVVLVADLHVGAPHWPEARLPSLIAQINALDADLVVIAGDLLVDGQLGATFVPAARLAPHLAKLRARLGVFAVLGNHDWWGDGPGVTGALQDAGVVVLENTHHVVPARDAGVVLVGLGDSWTVGASWDDAVRGAPPGPRIGVAHSPDVFPALPAEATLTLAGHTHGGQVWLPLVGRLVVPSRFGQKYARGLVRDGAKQLFVTSGLGTSILPVRFLVPPEVVRLTLRAAP